MAYTKKELSQMDSDHDYWDEFVDAIGWKLAGWTGRSSALIDTGRKNVYLPSFSITGAGLRFFLTPSHSRLRQSRLGQQSGRRLEILYQS